MTFNTRAIILRRDDFDGPDSRLLLLSNTHGKIELIAKGLRRLTSKLAAHARPGLVADCFVVQGRRRKLFAGSVVEEKDDGLSLSQQYIQGAILRVTDALVPLEQHDLEQFSRLETALKLVRTNAPHINLLPHLYAWQLLVHSGYAQQLSECMVCSQSLSGEEKVFLDVRRGGLAHTRCVLDEATPGVMLHRAAVNGLRHMSEAPLSDALRLRADDEIFNEMLRAIEAVVEERFDAPSGGKLWVLHP